MQVNLVQLNFPQENWGNGCYSCREIISIPQTFMIACDSPCCIEEIFELMMEYFKLLNKCFAIFSRVLGYSCKHEFCSNQIFRAGIPVKLVLYGMLDFLLKFSIQSVNKEIMFTTKGCPTVFVYVQHCNWVY